ncbi:hypothetical protein L596_024376 [Steinernema carpocapsae]|uniref:Uncharacterized protein n=1 Tax=Steinernema carpocapsae TaxID=34508 RepID=A0A4U5MGJ7_STECR|nr:hypothetical protein L596_024376 [Steinernema carpocapsae]
MPAPVPIRSHPSSLASAVSHIDRTSTNAIGASRALHNFVQKTSLPPSVGDRIFQYACFFRSVRLQTKLVPKGIQQPRSLVPQKGKEKKCDEARDRLRGP